MSVVTNGTGCLACKRVMTGVTNDRTPEYWTSRVLAPRLPVGRVRDWKGW